MTIDFSRRVFLVAAGAMLAGCGSQSARQTAAHRALANIEDRIGGRLGLYAVATDSNAVLAQRENERFAMCSTFKWALVAAVLSKVEQGKLTLAQAVEYGEKDLLEYAPVTRQHIGHGHLTIRELAEAAVTLSDNTAANLLLDRVGGPAGLTQFLRDHGDSVTRLDRNEPMLNINEPGDPRDTTSPRAMVTTLQTLLTTAALAPESRELLLGWMIASRTGSERIRAGLPGTWRVGDKTGTGMHGAVNDVAIVWPPNRAPILIAVYLSGSESAQSALNDAHRQVGRIVAAHLGTSHAPNG